MRKKGDLMHISPSLCFKAQPRTPGQPQISLNV